MAASLALHDAIVRDAIESGGGYVFSTAGDSFGAAFARASDAVAAALETQAPPRAAAWPGPALRVRVGLHLGEAEERGGDYFGADGEYGGAGRGGWSRRAGAADGAGEGDGAGRRGRSGRARASRRGRAAAVVPVRRRSRFPPMRLTDPAMTNLPVRPTRLIGRDEDVVAVRKLLAEHRL